MPSRDTTALELSCDSSVEVKIEIELELEVEVEGDVSAAGAVTSVLTYP
jgi:hypothetical protein